MTNNHEQKIPDQVIRFYGNTNYALECIALKQITFLHLEKLNDPFDPVLDIITDFNDSYSSLLSYVQAHHPDQIEYFKNKLPEQNWNNIVANWSNLSSGIRAKMFVFSTCDVVAENHPRDNLYMWSHYGDGHRGIAIEFNANALAESVTGLNDLNNESPWWKMKYANKIQKIDCEDVIELVMAAEQNANNLQSYGPRLYSKILQQINFKGEVWRNEDE